MHFLRNDGKKKYILSDFIFINNIFDIYCFCTQKTNKTLRRQNIITIFTRTRICLFHFLMNFSKLFVRLDFSLFLYYDIIAIKIFAQPVHYASNSL